MKILLINPSNYDGNGKLVKSNYSGLLPLALPFIAGLSNGIAETRVINEYVDDVPSGEDFDLVAISGQRIKARRVKELTRMFSKENTPVVVGGPICNPVLESDLEDLVNDGAILSFGPAENSWLQIISDAKEGVLRERYDSPKVTSLKGLPIPDYKDFDPRKYDEDAFLYVESSRGCPNTCTFCDGFHYHPSYMPRPIEDIVRDISSLKKSTGMSNFHFTDSNLLIGTKRAYRLFDALEKLGITWGCSSDMQFMTPESIIAAANSGCDFISMGVESLNEENLTYCQKQFNDPERLQGIIQTCKDNNISLFINLIYGLDHDTPQSIAGDTDRLIEYGAETVYFHVLDPTEGTKLYDQILQEGRLGKRLPNGMNSFVPKGMTYQELVQATSNATVKFYSDHSIEKRISPERSDILRLNKTFQDNANKQSDSLW